MKPIHLGLLLAALASGCASARSAPAPSTAEAAPDPAALTTAPLRNRVRVELAARPSDVWALVGDHERLPEYSAGLLRVDVGAGPGGAPAEYVCHFRPAVEGGEALAHRELVRWRAAERGFASIAEEPNAFGLRNALTLVTLEPSTAGTLLTWDQHFDADDVAANEAEFDRALADIAERLVARFGGRVVASR